MHGQLGRQERWRNDMKLRVVVMRMRKGVRISRLRGECW